MQSTRWFSFFFHFDSKGAKVRKSRRSRKMLKNDAFVAKVGVDKGENEPRKRKKKGYALKDAARPPLVILILKSHLPPQTPPILSFPSLRSHRERCSPLEMNTSSPGREDESHSGFVERRAMFSLLNRCRAACIYIDFERR